jgi:hypothetical protein
MKRQKADNHRKLKLRTETLHALERTELVAVRGGAAADTIVGTVTAGCPAGAADE